MLRDAISQACLSGEMEARLREMWAEPRPSEAQEPDCTSPASAPERKEAGTAQGDVTEKSGPPKSAAEDVVPAAKAVSEQDQIVSVSGTRGKPGELAGVWQKDDVLDAHEEDDVEGLVYYSLGKAVHQASRTSSHTTSSTPKQADDRSQANGADASYLLSEIFGTLTQGSGLLPVNEFRQFAEFCDLERAGASWDEEAQAVSRERGWRRDSGLTEEQFASYMRATQRCWQDNLSTILRKVERLRESAMLLSALDKNGDGAVSKAELAEGMRRRSRACASTPRRPQDASDASGCSFHPDTDFGSEEQSDDEVY